MPPKKRTSTVANSDATGSSPKRTRKPVSETAATSRPKRLSLTKLPPRAAKLKTTTAAAAAAKPKTTARTPSASKASDTPKKRGRPSLKGATPAKATAAKPSKPSKKVTATSRPKVTAAKATAAGKLAKRRGRPPKSASSSLSSTGTTTSKKRKRTVENPKQVSKDVPKKETGKRVKKQPVTRRPRKPSYLKEKEPDLTIEVAEDNAYGPDGRSYWLMKAEPESRLVKGVDVKFSIDDLRAATEPEPWDGVRNPVARNNIRAMKKGDYAFFYHSSCKVPGIVGEMEIVKEHSVDESAFDPSHPYYDEKSSRENPKWEVVHVEFRRKFDKPLTLETLKAHALPGLPLDNLQTIRQSRVSVSRVTPKEWEYIKKLIDEQSKIDEKADVEMKDSGEAETNTKENGETANDTVPEPASEPVPQPESATGAAEPTPSSAPPTEPTTAASDKQPVENAEKPGDKPEETGSKDEDSSAKAGGESQENGVNGQTTTERLASVITGAFMTN